jgi:predicted dehydrogenase
VLGANDTVRLGVVGIRGRGGDHVNEFLQVPGVQVTHLVDPDSRLFANRTKHVKEKGGNTPKCFQDIRKALEDKDLDAHILEAHCSSALCHVANISYRLGQDT